MLLVAPLILMLCASLLRVHGHPDPSSAPAQWQVVNEDCVSGQHLHDPVFDPALFILSELLS